MTPEHWAKVRALLEQTTDLPMAEREAILAATDAGPETIDEVRHLLSFERQASAIFSIDTWQEGAAHIAAELDPTGMLVGSYRLEQEIGRGGMGAVYLAQRADGSYQQKVAVKILQENIFTASLSERFRQERQILARLTHPGIARLLDGGVMPDGRPYLVLEYVDGIPIDQFCEEHKLDTDARLRLFLRVAEVVQSAHQQFVLHLDLKPANILVTPEGEPRLLDFGIARFLSVDADGASATETTLRLLTPRYASPEQASGATLGVPSDIFSLATLLYRLLTQHLPYPLETAQPLEAARILCETPPAIPSRWNEGLKGDLDTILLQALRKEPERRYPTIAAFADDLRRHLEQRPVLAHSDTFGYRSAKFIRRNRAAVIVTGAAALALIASGAAIVRSAMIARQERATAERRLMDTRKLAKSYIEELIPKLMDVPGTLEVRKLMMSNAVTYLQAMSRERTNDPALEGELASGFYYLATMQGDPYVPNLNNPKAAMELYRGSLAIQRQVLKRTPADLQEEGRYMLILQQMSTVPNGNGEILEAMGLGRQAWEAAQTVIAGHPKGSRYITFGNIANHMAINESGEGVWSLADPEQSVAWIDKGLAVYRQFTSANPAEAKTARYLATETAMQQVKAQALLKLGRDEEARAIYAQYLPLVDATDPKNDRPFLETRRWLYGNYANFLRLHGDLPRATQLATVVRPENYHEMTDGAGNLYSRLQLADELALTAVFDLANHKTAAGRAEREQSLAGYRAMRNEAPELMWTTSGLSHHLLEFAEMQETPKQEAQAMFAEAIDVVTPYAAAHPQVLSAQVDLGRAHLGLARTGEQQHSEAVKALALLEPVFRLRPGYLELGRLIQAARELA